MPTWSGLGGLRGGSHRLNRMIPRGFFPPGSQSRCRGLARKQVETSSISRQVDLIEPFRGVTFRSDLGSREQCVTETFLAHEIPYVPYRSVVSFAWLEN